MEEESPAALSVRSDFCSPLSAADAFALSNVAVAAGSPAVVLIDGFLSTDAVQQARIATEVLKNEQRLSPAGLGSGDSYWKDKQTRGDLIMWANTGERQGILPSALQLVHMKMKTLITGGDVTVSLPSTSAAGGDRGGGGGGDGVDGPSSGRREEEQEEKAGEVNNETYDSTPTNPAAFLKNGLRITDRTSTQIAYYLGDGLGYVKHLDVAKPGTRAVVAAGSEVAAEEDVEERRLTAVCYLTPGWLPSDGGQLRIFLRTGGFWDVEPKPGRLVLFRSDIVEHEVRPAYRPRVALTTWFYGKDMINSSPLLSTPKPQERALHLSSTPQQQQQQQQRDSMNDPYSPQQDTRSKVRPLPVPEENVVDSTSSSNSTSGGGGGGGSCGGASRARFDSNTSSIFVSIVSYLDSETVPTIIDLFERARYPGRITVGLVWQGDSNPLVGDENDEDGGCGGGGVVVGGGSGGDRLTVNSHASTHGNGHIDVDTGGGYGKGGGESSGGGHVPKKYLQRIRFIRIPPAQAAGPCWARRIAQSLWSGEHYVLQIDSHMRFRPNWDVYLITTLARCPSEKAVLTAYPTGYTLPHVIPCGETRPTLLCPTEFASSSPGSLSDGMLRQKGRLLKARHRKPLRSPLWASGFSFSTSELLLTVPYDPYLRHIFFGEEISMAARMFTHGFDTFAPPQAVVYHLWTREHRPSFRQYASSEKDAEKARALERIRTLLGMTDGTTTTTTRTSTSSKSSNGSSGSDDISGGHCRTIQEDQIQLHDSRQPTQPHLHLASHPGGYGLGTIRTLQEFERHVGVNFATRTLVDPKAKDGGLMPDEFNDDYNNKAHTHLLNGLFATNANNVNAAGAAASPSALAAAFRVTSLK